MVKLFYKKKMHLAERLPSDSTKTGQDITFGSEGLIGLLERFFSPPRKTHTKEAVPANAPALGAMIHDEGAPVRRGPHADQKSTRITVRT